MNTVHMKLNRAAGNRSPRDNNCAAFADTFLEIYDPENRRVDLAIANRGFLQCHSTGAES